VRTGRELLTKTLPGLGSVKALVADRGYKALDKMAAKHGLVLDIKAPPKGTSGFTRIAPLYRVEHAFARLGRWRRPFWAAGGGPCAASTDLPRAPAPGSKSPPWPTCPPGSRSSRCDCPAYENGR